MNILLVIPALNIGGAEITVVNLANNLSRLGHKVFLFECYNKRNQDLVNTIDKKVKVISLLELSQTGKLVNNFCNIFLKKIIGKNKVYHFLQAKRFRNVVNRENIDVINSHLPSADYFVYMTLGPKMIANIKWVVSMHGSYENNTGVHHLSSVIFKYVDGVIYLTDKNLSILEQQSNRINSNLVTKKIYNCLGDWQLNKPAENYQFKLESDLFTFGLISRGDYRKGWVESIDAVIKLNESGYNCRLILAGDGPDRQRIQEAYKGYSYIIFLGYVNNPIQLISYFDVGLLPSYFESLPYTIIEYLKANKPVVATAVGEIEYMIMDREYPSGQLVTVSDKGVDREGLYKALLRYLNNRELYLDHTKNASMNYSKFEPENWGKQIVSFYSSLKNK